MLRGEFRILTFVPWLMTMISRTIFNLIQRIFNEVMIRKAIEYICSNDERDKQFPKMQLTTKRNATVGEL